MGDMFIHARKNVIIDIRYLFADFECKLYWKNQ